MVFALWLDAESEDYCARPITGPQAGRWTERASSRLALLERIHAHKPPASETHEFRWLGYLDNPTTDALERAVMERYT